MKDTINIGILGLGVVGSGTVELLRRNQADIARKIGAPVSLRKVAVRDLAKQRAVEIDRAILTDDASEVLDDPAIDIVCELIGGVSPAGEYVMRALQSGKSVVTANKELIAKAGHDAMEEAARRKLDLLFEGAVGGGIPIVQPMKNALAGNTIYEVKGIVNGTTNYILTKMTREGADFDRVLAEAQARGYAEADPTSDVGGFDAQYKTAILSSIAFTSRVHVDDVYVEGIAHITARDIQCARALGYTIKLLGIGTRVGDDGILLRVHPVLLPDSHPLAAVNDVYNAIMVTGDGVGDVMFYGRGAGMMPTGSAVVGDIIEAGRNLVNGSTGRVPCTCFEERTPLPMGSVETGYYIRMSVSDDPGTLAAIAGVMGRNNVSIGHVHADAHEKAEAVWVTHRVRESNMRRAIAEISALDCVRGVENWLRVEE